MANPTVEIPGSAVVTSGLAKVTLGVAGVPVTVQDTAAKGAANGYAGLDGSGKVPSGQLPAAGGVSSFNTLTGAVTISAGSNITLTPAGNDVAISASGSVSAALAWLIDVSVYGVPIASVGTWANTYSVAAALHAAVKANSTAAQNDSISFDLVLGAGTWTLEIIHDKATNQGIGTVTLGAISVGTFDGFASSTTRNVSTVFTGISVPADGKYRLTILLATKNASSSAFALNLEHIQLRRTA